MQERFDDYTVELAAKFAEDLITHVYKVHKDSPQIEPISVVVELLNCLMVTFLEDRLIYQKDVKSVLNQLHERNLLELMESPSEDKC